MIKETSYYKYSCNNTCHCVNKITNQAKQQEVTKGASHIINTAVIIPVGINKRTDLIFLNEISYFRLIYLFSSSNVCGDIKEWEK